MSKLEHFLLTFIISLCAILGILGDDIAALFCAVFAGLYVMLIINTKKPQ